MAMAAISSCLVTTGSFAIVSTVLRSRKSTVTLAAPERSGGKGIWRPKRKRRLSRVDPESRIVEYKWPFLETHERLCKESGQQVLVDVDTLIQRSSNPFGLVLEIAEEANEYLRNDRDGSLLRKPVLRAISNRINEAAGEQLTDSYIEDVPEFPEMLE